MDLKEYQELCKKTATPFDNKEKEIMTWGLGFSGEAGDVASCIKKTVAHGNNQEIGIRENIGDSLWYAAMICNFFGWNFREVLEENVKKLEKRYPNGFSFEEAQREGNKVDWGEK